MASGSAFIDQNLAAQLFVAARAHDSLRLEPETLLPTAITEIFTIPTAHSHRYRTATYSALAKSQQQQQQPSLQRLATYHDDQPAAAGTTHPPTPPQQESKLLQIARNEPRILKMIVTYLGINDKQSLMFAVTEENYKLEKEENHLSLSNSSDMVTGGKGISGSNGGGAGSGSSSGTTTLAEDIYHRELEELDHIRSEYLTQLAQTREYESKMDDLQQQIDRAKLILHNNPDDSGDLLLLNYMASRLYLLKELTSRDYDDFFTARAQYSSWCNEQQQLYLQLGKESLFYQKKYLKISKLIQKLSFEQTKRFLYQITLQPLEPTPFLDSLPTSYTDSSPPPNPPQLSSNTSSSSHTYGSDQGNKKTIQFRVRTKLSFEKLTEEGKHLVSKYSNNFGHTPHVSPRPAISSLSNTPRATSSPMERSQSMERSVSSPQITPRVELPSPVTNAPVSPSPSPIENLGSLLSEFERELTVSLSEYEQNVCDTMENLSQMSLEAIRKKFINLNDTNDLPRYVEDIQRRIEEKGNLVTTNSDSREMVRENITAEFEERIQQSYEWLLEQQMNRLKRIQGRY